MTLAPGATPLSEQQHIVLDGVSWDFYEQLLREIGERPIRITFDRGRLEIMSPLPKHELWGAWINRLIEQMCFELSIPIAALGSTTFRSSKKCKGLEPDKCFYIQNVAAGLRIEEEFDPAMHPAPDLAVEIDITSRSVQREPIYAALGVAELWRFDGSTLQVLRLSGEGSYVSAGESLAFPFLPMQEFAVFVRRRRDHDQLGVLREFQQWVRSLKR